jgi:hypothetical protein
MQALKGAGPAGGVLWFMRLRYLTSSDTKSVGFPIPSVPEPRAALLARIPALVLAYPYPHEPALIGMMGTFLWE